MFNQPELNKHKIGDFLAAVETKKTKIKPNPIVK